MYFKARSSILVITKNVVNIILYVDDLTNFHRNFIRIENRNSNPKIINLVIFVDYLILLNLLRFRFFVARTWRSTSPSFQIAQVRKLTILHFMIVMPLRVVSRVGVMKYRRLDRFFDNVEQLISLFAILIYEISD